MRKGKMLVPVLVCLLAAGASANLLENAGFDAAGGAPIPEWTSVGVGPSDTTVWTADTAIPGYTGSHAATYISWSGDPDAGYLYQQVSGIKVGTLMDASVDAAWYVGGGFAPGEFPRGLAIDPNGGTDINAAGVVSNIVAPSGQATWETISVNGVAAQSNTVTMFIYAEGPGISPTWWAHGLDNAVLVPEPAGLVLLALGGLLIRRHRRA